MKFSSLVHFNVPSKDSGYDPISGEDVSIGNTVNRWANVTDLGTEKTVELFGGLENRYIAIRVQAGEVPPGWDTLTVGTEKTVYQKTTGREALKGAAILAREVLGRGTN